MEKLTTMTHPVEAGQTFVVEATDRLKGERSPLTGIRVLDFTRFLAGPHCTRMLSDLGADVIKLEPPKHGDISRTMGMRVNHMSLYYLQHNAGKRNISVDLTAPEGVELASRLAEHCDVLVENFVPGVMDKLGLSYETLAERNPRLVYVSISGYGQTGAWRHRKAFAPVIHAEAGLTAIHARRFGEDHPFEATAHADVYTGLEGLVGALAALYHRQITGQGQHVDVSMAGTMLSVNDRVATELHAEDPGKYDGAGTVVVELAGGGKAVISGDIRNKTVFHDYCQAMGRPDLETDPRFIDVKQRGIYRAELLAVIREWVLGFDDFQVLEARLAEIHLPIGRVATIKEIAASPWAESTDAFAEVSDRQGGTARIPQSPWRFSRAWSGARGSAAFPGEHNAEVMKEVLGLGPDEISDLEAQGVLRERLPDDMTVDRIPAPISGRHDKH